MFDLGPKVLKNLFFGLIIFASLSSCQSKYDPGASYQRGILTTPRSKTIETIVAETASQQTQGLSGVKAESFKENQAMIFYYPTEGYRSFWMPDTYFNLDIFFLSPKLKILAIERNVAHHPGKSEPPAIARTPTIYCAHVLELKAGSSISKELAVGDILTWSSKTSQLQIAPSTLQKK
mgnify:CR=1 FL=1